MHWLHYCFEAMAQGRMPASRLDHKPWREQDSERASLAGQDMPRRAVLTQLRLDWAELCERLGFPTWHSNIRPCPSCATSPDTLYDLSTTRLDHSPWHLNTHEDWETSCSACENRVVVTHELVLQLQPLLRYDKRLNGSLGLSLTEPVPELGLHTGDRLEPTPEFPDIGMFAELCPNPGDSKGSVLASRRREHDPAQVSFVRRSPGYHT